jgi:hypothetical protein
MHGSKMDNFAAQQFCAFAMATNPEFKQHRLNRMGAFDDNRLKIHTA